MVKKIVFMNKSRPTKEKILNAAIEEFIEYGLYGARMKRIANKAKVNKALLHYYFKNKNFIYKEAIKVVFEDLINRLNKISEEDCNVEKKIEQILDVYSEFITTNYKNIKLVIYEIIRGGDNILLLIKENLERIPFNPINGKLYKFFKNKIIKGELKKIEPLHIFISIVALFAPVIFIKDLAKKIFNLFGFDSKLADKFINERKRIAVEIIKDGILLNKKESKL